MENIRHDPDQLRRLRSRALSRLRPSGALRLDLAHVVQGAEDRRQLALEPAGAAAELAQPLDGAGTRAESAPRIRQRRRERVRAPRKGTGAAAARDGGAASLQGRVDRRSRIHRAAATAEPAESAGQRCEACSARSGVAITLTRSPCPPCTRRSRQGLWSQASPRPSAGS